MSERERERAGVAKKTKKIKMARKQIFVRERDFKSYLPLHVPERYMYATRSMAELVAFRETSIIDFCGYPGHLSLSLVNITSSYRHLL